MTEAEGAKYIAPEPQLTPSKTIIDAGNVDVDALDIPDWLRKGLKKLDVDGDGLEKSELYDVLTRVAAEKEAVSKNTGEIHYEHMPAKVKEVFAMWDHDQSGSVSHGELLSAAKAQQKLQKENRVVKRLLFASVIVIILLAVLNFVMSLAAVEAGKDFKPKDSSSGATSRRRLQAMGGSRDKGALADAEGTLMGTVLPTETYADMAEFHSERPPKEMLENIQTYSFFDPNTNTMSNRRIQSAEFVDGELLMRDMNGYELAILPDGSTVETKPDGGSRVVPNERPNGLLTPKDAGKRELIIASPPVTPDLPTGNDVPALHDSCPWHDGQPMCDKTGLKDFVHRMFDSGDKGGITGTEPTAAAVDTFFDGADCDSDGFVSRHEMDLAENGIPCAQNRRRLREVHGAHRPYRVRRLEAQRRRRLAHGPEDASLTPDVGPPDNCVPVIENAHIMLDDNPSTSRLPAKRRGPAMAKMLALDTNTDGCVDDEEHKALKMDHLEGAAPMDCSKIQPPRLCKCLPEGVNSIKLENKKNLLPQCQGKFHELDRNADGVVTRKECDEGSASKAEDDFFKMLRYDGTCPQNTGLITMQAFVDFRVGQEGEDSMQAEIYAKVADMDGDGWLDMVEAASSPVSIFNDLHGNYTDYNPGNISRRLQSHTGNKRRLRLIQKLMEPRKLERVHKREQRRLQRELTVRKRMLSKVGDMRYSSWLDTRMEIGKSRRRLTEGGELQKENFVSMNTEELEGMVASWGESERHRRLSERFAGSSTRRLLGLTPDPHRRLNANFSAEEQEMYDEIYQSFGNVSSVASHLETFVTDHSAEFWDASVKEDYEACPSPFYLHRHEDYAVDDYNTAHDYPANTDILVGDDATNALADSLGITKEQAEYKITHLYGPPGAETNKGRRHRLRRLAERDPLHRRRLQGEFGNLDPLADVPPMPSLDQCEFLQLSDRQQYDKLMSGEAAQLAYFDGEADYCYHAIDALPDNGGYGDHCIMPTNSYVDPSTHEIRHDNPQATIDPFQYAAAHTLDDAACAHLPWEEKIRPTTFSGGRVIRDMNSTYADNWDHEKPGKGCARTCCNPGNHTDCTGDNLYRDCPCLKEKKKCMRRMTDKLITANSGGSGPTQRRMRRLLRRLASKNVVAERRRRRLHAKLLPFERRRLEVKERSKRMERRRLDEFRDSYNRDGSHNFCYMHNNFSDYCNWDFGCTYLNATNSCVPCSGAVSAADCQGSCMFSGSVCALPNECTGIPIESCEMTPGCSYSGAACKKCDTLEAWECAGPGCRLNEMQVCVVDDGFGDGPTGENFDYDCPLQTTVLEATCAIVGGLDCSQGYPNEENLTYYYGNMSFAEQGMLREMTSTGLTEEEREAIVEYNTVEQYPIDFDDLDTLDTNADWRHLSTNGEQRMMPIFDASMYAYEDPYAYVSTNGQTLSSTDTYDFLKRCNENEQDAPTSGYMQDTFCTDIAQVDDAMHAYGNSIYEVEFHECHHLTENTLAHHLIDLGGDSGTINQAVYKCSCTQTYHMSGEECDAHYHESASNGEMGMTWSEFHEPPAQYNAYAQSEGEPLTPDALMESTRNYHMHQPHDEAISTIEENAKAIYWLLFDAAQTNAIPLNRRLFTEEELAGTFGAEDEDPVCDPIGASQVGLSTLYEIEWRLNDMRYALTTLENFFRHNSTERRLRGHEGARRRLQEYNSTDFYNLAQSLRSSTDSALSALRVLLVDGNDYQTLYSLPPAVLSLVCVDLDPENLPYGAKNVVLYEPDNFEEPFFEGSGASGFESSGFGGSGFDGSGFGGSGFDGSGFGGSGFDGSGYDEWMPEPGEPIELSGLNPLPDFPLDFDAPSRCDNDPMNCKYQGEEPFLYHDTDYNSATPLNRAVVWQQDNGNALAETDRVHPAAARFMETHAYPWEYTEHEFAHQVDRVRAPASDHITQKKREGRAERSNRDSGDPSFAAELSTPERRKPKEKAQIRGLVKNIRPPTGRPVISHPIPPGDRRTPAETCKEYVGVKSGLREGTVSNTGVLSGHRNVDLYKECKKHRAKERAFEVTNDVRHAVANRRATETITTRLRRRLVAEYGDNPPHHVRRLLDSAGENPMTFVRKHQVHRKRGLRAHARRLKVQQNRRRRVLRRRLEGSDEELPTVDHDLTPSVVDRMLQGQDPNYDIVLAHAQKQHLMAEFDVEMRMELAKPELQGDAVLDQLPADDFEIMVETMHEYFATFVDVDQGGENETPCLAYDPVVSSLTVTNDKVVLSASDKALFQRCTDTFHSGVPEEFYEFADEMGNGNINEDQFFDETFPGMMPGEGEVGNQEGAKKKIFESLNFIPKECYCECKRNEAYGLAFVTGACNVATANVGNSTHQKSPCELIMAARMDEKLESCAPPATGGNGWTRRLAVADTSTNPADCLTINGEEYCKQGALSKADNQLGTQLHRGRKLRKSVARRLNGVRKPRMNRAYSKRQRRGRHPNRLRPKKKFAKR